jgi:hypothetical protein
MDIHIQSYKTDIYKNGVINMGTKLYHKMPDYIKEMNNYKVFKKELKSVLFFSCFLVSEGICPIVIYNM